MRNIFLVLKREYLVRVRKKSFIVMTLLTPLLIAAFYGIIIWAAVGSFNNERKTIQVIDESGLFKNKFKSDANTTFEFISGPIATAQKQRAEPSGIYPRRYHGPAEGRADLCRQKHRPYATKSH